MRPIAFLACLLSLPLVACGRAESPAPAAAPAQPRDAVRVEAPLPADGLIASVQSGELELVTSAGETAVLDVEGRRALAVGDSVAVRDGGMALLQQQGQFSVELVSGVAVEITQMGTATTLTVNRGIARATLVGAAPLTMVAPGVSLTAHAEAADVIVDASSDVVWLVMLAGQAELSRLVASRSGATTQSLLAGQAVAIAPQQSAGEPVAIDLPAVKRWYLGAASGTADRPLGAIAFRCVVHADTTLAYDPVTDAAQADSLETLAVGSLVDALAREASGDWLHVVAVESGTEGWVQSADVGCVGPLTLLSAEEALVTVDEPAPAVGVAAVGAPAVPLSAAPQATPSPTALASGAPGTTIDTGSVGDTDDGSAGTQPQDPAAPTPTPCETDCEIVAPPTETPRPPRPTRAPTDPPPTDAPAEPTDAPPEPTDEPPPPDPTDEPEPEPTDEPPEEPPLLGQRPI